MARSTLMPIGLIAAASAAEPDTHKKPLGSETSSSGSTLILSSEEMKTS